ncbi:hypothetical protein M9979_03525 [Sphingomonas sp. RP10(2022)]|uniref:GAF domain-containing protein n=1 Tax=Sphingomonas liriopis TaxID=2949094 RepID=A0A9X2KNS1_9SPHN|nr:hypothetical protein [Sphingomonas liriopis]MCP3733944.1 hypothetical protein [Sphingomonas liriopis]
MTPATPARWRRPLRIAVEMAVGFGGLAALDWFLIGGFGFERVQPNPYWLPVLVAALAYGTAPGVIAAAIASALWVLAGHHHAGERDYLDHLFHLSLLPLLWFVSAVVIGEVTIVRTGRQARLERRGRVATRNVARLSEAFDALSRTNRRLQVQIATEAGTLGHVIATATHLSSAAPGERREAIVRLIALAARSEDFTCYRVAGDEARAWLRSSQSSGRRDVLPVMLMERLIRRRGIVHVARRSDRASLDGVGVAAVPLIDGAGRLAGCLVLHALPFAALNAGRVAELTEIATWLTPLLADAPRTLHRPAGLVA